MKQIYLLLAALLTVGSANAQITETSFDAVKNMGVGWNLGNTLDASGGNVKDFTSDNYWGNQGVDSETYWGQPKATFALITMMKKAGFGAIRVPVTWYNHMDKDGKVDAKWMARVHEVVDYVIDNGLYCILNVHHDTGADSNSHSSWIKADESNYTANKARYEYLWKQIATEFKDYDKHLLFEGYNEMLDKENSWCFASFNTSSKYNATIATSAYKGINGYAQSFVDAVRATGGNNASRNLIVNTYAAANGYGTWNTHLKDPLTNMQMPKDNIEQRIIFEVHDYPQIAQTNNGVTTDRSLTEIKSQVNGTIKGLKDYLVKLGGPVIIGEWGTSNVDSGAGKTDYDLRRSLMFQFVDYYVQQSKANGIAMFYWMGLTDGQYRGIPAFSQADLAERIAKAYHGSDFIGEYPEASQATTLVPFEGEKAIAWGNGISIPASSFKMVGTGAKMMVTYKQTGGSDDMQLFYGDWSEKLSFFVDGKKYSGDIVPHTHYGTPTGSVHTSAFTFDDSTYNLLTQKGLIIHGNNVTITKIELTNTTGISSTYADKMSDEVIYNLSGQKVTVLKPGIYIKNGKKFCVK